MLIYISATKKSCTIF